MNKSGKYIIIGVVLLLLVGLIYYFGGNNDSKKPSKDAKGNATLVDTATVKKPINPAGTYLLYNLLKSYPNTVSIETIQTTVKLGLKKLLPKKNNNKKPNLYISISENYELKNADLNHLMDFVEEGNYALISSRYFSSDFEFEVLSETSILNWYDYDTAVAINFTHPKFRNQHDLKLLSEDINFHGKPKYKSFSFFNEYLSNESIIVISKSEERINCIMVPYGDGFFIVHSQPGNFSNINLARVDGKTNAENILSHFPENNIYWHQNFGKYSEYRGITKPKYNKPPKQYSRSSPLQYIFKQPALFIALILLLVGTALYILVFSKRKQKIIPPIESNENSSLEFVDIISKLYFQQKQHNKLINHMIQIYISFIRERYFINLTQKDGNIVERISEKSGVDVDRVKLILDTFKSAKTKQFKEQELIDLHKQLEYFYKNCN